MKQKLEEAIKRADQMEEELKASKAELKNLKKVEK